MDAILLAILILGAAGLLSWPLGRYLRWAMDPVALDGVAGRFDRLFRAFGGRWCRQEQGWKQYLFALLTCNVLMFAICFAFLALQQALPLNPDGKEALTGDLIFNTAASF